MYMRMYTHISVCICTYCICTKCICTCIMCKCTYIYFVHVRDIYIYIYTSLEHIPPSNLLLKKTHGTGVGNGGKVPNPSTTAIGCFSRFRSLLRGHVYALETLPPGCNRNPQDATVTPRMQPSPPGCNRYLSLPPGCNRYHQDDILTYF